MAGSEEYLTLSKRFESLAATATDPKLAAVYRSLAQQYRILDAWRERMGQRYELSNSLPAPRAARPPPLRPRRP